MKVIHPQGEPSMTTFKTTLSAALLAGVAVIASPAMAQGSAAGTAASGTGTSATAAGTGGPGTAPGSSASATPATTGGTANAGTTGAAVGSKAGATVTATGIAPADGSNKIDGSTSVMGAASMEIKPNVPTVVIGGPTLQVLNAPQNTVNSPTFQRWMKLR
jgi:hypothetical protein